MVLPTDYTLQEKRLVNLNTVEENMEDGTQRKKFKAQ